MNHLGTQPLESERLLLRRFVVEDAGSMFDNWASDPEVIRHLNWPRHETVDDSRTVLTKWIERYQEDNFYEWAICLKENGQLIGSIESVLTQDDAGMVHVSYSIGRPFWRQGYMSEALSRVIEFFFEEVGVNKVECCFSPANPNSGGVMRKAGMKEEGTIRQTLRINSGITDLIYYGLLRTEYFTSGQE